MPWCGLCSGKIPATPLLSRVEAPVVAGEGKVVHKTPMLSLDKAYSLEEVLSWAGKFCRGTHEKLLVQPKYDGISAIWDGQVLATRGDGMEGENITDKAALIELEHPAGIFALAGCKTPARGEIVIREDDFRTLYQHIRNRNGRIYKNPRNAVAGIMGLKEIGDMLKQGAKLTLVDYSLYSWESEYGRLRDDWAALVENIEKLPYPMDGIVVKLADAEYSAGLGNTAHHPRGQIAFKFTNVRRTTILRSVEWSAGKDCLTPVAVFDPVEIGGTTITHATLHNLQNVLDRDLRLGDVITVERAGDVIPYVSASEPGVERRSCLIDECPYCGATLKRDLPELRCVNPECPGTRLQRLAAAVRNIGIERLGEPTLEKMMKTLGVRTLKDIFGLGKADLLRLEGFASQSADNLLAEIAKARQVPDWKILASLNIKGIGPNIAKAILAVHPLEELRRLTVLELGMIDGIGPERASALEQELREQSDALDELLACVEVQRSGASADGRPTICFTGKMPEKRSHYVALAERRGMAFADSVTSSLSLLVAMDPTENSSKLKKARNLGIPIQSLEEWLAGATE
ncbi:MAG: hypothetical protein IJJ33_14965 [Victivallales bacterium]|nr:hypothetical protein [Victivallales bacterium]